MDEKYIKCTECKSTFPISRLIFDYSRDEERCPVCNGVDTVINILPVSDNWITVTDGLPEKPGLYNVFNGAVVFSVQYSRIDIYGDMPEYAKNNNGFDWPCKITHWQQLPNKPKVKE